MLAPQHPAPPQAGSSAAGLERSSASWLDLLTWLGEAKRSLFACTAMAAAASTAVALLMTPVYTARTSLLPPGSQQQSGSAAALAALGSLGGLAGGLGTAKTPDDLYVALLRSDSLMKALDQRFKLRDRQGVEHFEALRRVWPKFIRVSSDKKSGVITVEVDDPDPKFAAELANAHVGEVARVLGRLAVSEAQQRRVFFEQQMRDTKENLVKAEADLRRVQEKSGVIALDKQAEALISGAAQVRALIAEREVQLKVMLTSATDQNPDVIRLRSELRALRSELARMESDSSGGASTVDMPVGKIPGVAVDYVRARRELKLQETLLEAMVRQLEVARLDEAKESPLLQQVDVATPPDYKSKPARGMIIGASTMAALLISAGWVIARRFWSLRAAGRPDAGAAWQAARLAWRWRR